MLLNTVSKGSTTFNRLTAPVRDIRTSFGIFLVITSSLNMALASLLILLTKSSLVKFKSLISSIFKTAFFILLNLCWTSFDRSRCIKSIKGAVPTSLRSPSILSICLSCFLPPPFFLSSISAISSCVKAGRFVYPSSPSSPFLNVTVPFEPACVVIFVPSAVNIRSTIETARCSKLPPALLVNTFDISDTNSLLSPAFSAPFIPN